MKNNDMTSGNIKRAIICFSFPMVLTALLQQLYNIVDCIIAGYISMDSLAAVGAAGVITNLFLAVGNGCSSGGTIIISKYFGAKEKVKLKSAISTTVISMLIFGITFSVLGILFCELILQLIKTPIEIFNQTAVYLNICMVGITFSFLYNIANGIFTSFGDSKTPLYYLIFSSTLNLILDLVFTFMYDMGVVGLALATTISHFTSFVLVVISLTRLFKNIVIEKYKKFDIEIFKDWIVLSFPSVMKHSVISTGQIAVQGLINALGVNIIAAYTAAYKVIQVSTSCICMMSSAISKFTAQNYGAKKYDRIREGYNVGIAITTTLAIILCILTYTFSTNLLKLFAYGKINNEMLETGKKMLYILSPFFLSLAFKTVADGCIQGCLKAKVFVIGTLVNLFSRVILSYMLTPYFGFLGICIAFSSGWTFGALASTIVYRVVIIKEIKEFEEKKNTLVDLRENLC